MICILIFNYIFICNCSISFVRDNSENLSKVFTAAMGRSFTLKGGILFLYQMNVFFCFFKLFIGSSMQSG